MSCRQPMFICRKHHKKWWVIWKQNIFWTEPVFFFRNIVFLDWVACFSSFQFSRYVYISKFHAVKDFLLGSTKVCADICAAGPLQKAYRLCRTNLAGWSKQQNKFHQISRSIRGESISQTKLLVSQRHTTSVYIPNDALQRTENALPTWRRRLLGVRKSGASVSGIQFFMMRQSNAVTCDA